MMTDCNLYKSVLESIKDDETYQKGIEWGFKRSGHPEGSVKYHITELENNLIRLCELHEIRETEQAQIHLLIHTHDTLKFHARPFVNLANPYSHAYLARKFLSSYINDDDLLNMVQYHDEGYALYRKFKKSGTVSEERLSALIKNIKNWRVFLIFCIADNCTLGKDRDSLYWFIRQIRERIDTEIDESWILD